MKQKQLQGAGRKYIFGKDNDELLLEWLHAEREAKRGVSRKKLLDKAVKIYQESDIHGNQN